MEENPVFVAGTIIVTVLLCWLIGWGIEKIKDWGKD